jgi:SAM-dependent methyltransferase
VTPCDHSSAHLPREHAALAWASRGVHPLQSSACKICGNRHGNKEHLAREMMFGSRKEFLYLECGGCGCLQLMVAPLEMGLYYPEGYYAFEFPTKRARVREFLRKLKNRSYFGSASYFGRFWDSRHPYLQLRAFSSMEVSWDSTILDVGCGSGSFVRDLFSLGFRNVLGIDPFIAGDIECRGRVVVKKCGLNGLSPDAWDVVMFHHSFEHISDPHEALRAVRSLLAPNGQCLIRIPVVSWAWNCYGTNWVQIDAPRHFFLHTEKSFRMLAEKVGLVVTRIEYDSTEFQFWGSELNRRGVASGVVLPDSHFSRRELKDFKARARLLNDQHLGDQATFYLAVGRSKGTDCPSA